MILVYLSIIKRNIITVYFFYYLKKYNRIYEVEAISI